MSFDWINKESEKFLYKGYLSEGETPKSRIWDICKSAEDLLKIDGFAEKLYDYCSKGWVSFSSPIWANFGKKRGMPISCFSSYVGDSVSEILEAQSEVGIMSKLGGGTSGYFGDIRARGSEISDAGKTSGSVHFMELFEKMTDVVSQGGVRKGYFTPYLPVEHGDIDDFLNIATEGNPIQTMTTGVTITDDWMQSMIDGDNEKRKIWGKILKRRNEIGFPYIFNYDNVQRNAPDVYKDKGMRIKNSNLCVAPETKILTDCGYKMISEVEGEYVNVWNGEQWSNVFVQKTGVNQKLLKVTTDSGYELECTPYHKFYISTGYEKPYKEVRAHELKSGDKLCKFDLPVVEGTEELEDAYINGFYTGDGCQVGNNQRVYLYENKRKLKNLFQKENNTWVVQDECDREYTHFTHLKDKFFVPNEDFSIQSRLSWLSGFSDADGCIYRNGDNEQLVLSSIEKEFLKEVQMMLQTLGIMAKIRDAREEGFRKLPLNDGSGELSNFWCQKHYRLIITSNGLFKLKSFGFKTERLSFSAQKPQRDANRFVKVVDVCDKGRIDDTYCFNEPNQNKGMFNGILTGNCSEIVLPVNQDESFVCDLSSVNVAYYDDWKNTDLVETLIYFLDAVMSEFINKLDKYRLNDQKQDQLTFKNMERAYNFSKRHRALGLGVLGWHSFLQSKMIPFGSQRSIELSNEVFKNLQEKSYKASYELADIFGEPELLKGYGRRNTTLNAIAPTTSSAFILGQVSQSIEPLMSNYYIKDLAKTKAEIKNPYLKKLLQQKGFDTLEIWESIMKNDGSVQHLTDILSDNERNVFLTFSEINSYDIIEQASVRQKYLDQTQSLNLMIPTDFSVKDINKLMIYAWQKGICTLYYQHSVNAAQQFSNDCKACEA